MRRPRRFPMQICVTCPTCRSRARIIQRKTRPGSQVRGLFMHLSRGERRRLPEEHAVLCSGVFEIEASRDRSVVFAGASEIAARVEAEDNEDLVTEGQKSSANHTRGYLG